MSFWGSSDVGNITLWQRYPTPRPKYNQNLTLLQRRVPAALFYWIFLDRRLDTRRSPKGAAHCSFCRVLYNSYFGEFLLLNFASAWNNLLKHYISVDFLLIEGYVQSALRKGLLTALLVEHESIFSKLA